MNNNNLRTIMFIIIGVLILGVFLRVLPYIIIGGLGIYFIVKGYKYIKLKFNKTAKNIGAEKNTNSSSDTSDFTDDDFDVSDAIDVDYKDVK